MSVGGMIATLIGATTPLQFADGTVVIQDILDGMMPQMISLGLTGLMYWLIKKNVNTGWLLVIASWAVSPSPRPASWPSRDPALPPGACLASHTPGRLPSLTCDKGIVPLSHPQRAGDSVLTTVTLRASGNVTPQQIERNVSDVRDRP